MKTSSPLRLWIALGLVLLTTFAAHATTVIPPSFEEMTDRAELIFVGKVVRSRAEWRQVGPKRAIYTVVEFETEETLKGNSTPTVSLQFLGGTVGDVTMEISEVPKFKAGDRELLFVARNGVRFSPIVGVFHGKFGVQKDPTTGRESILRHNKKPLRDVSEIAAGEGSEFAPKRANVTIASDAQPLSLDDFKTKIRARLASGAVKK
jgi:hypothetical protein